MEDEALIAMELKSTLKSLGYVVAGHCMNGDKALDLFASTPADLIILDINIKGSLNGIDLAALIRKKYQIPFIFLTSYSDSNTLSQVQELMPYGYILKPFSDADLKVNIQLALHKFQAEIAEVEFTHQYAENFLKIKLNKREFDVLKAFKDGLTYKEAAARLHISVNTLKFYQKQVYQLLNVTSRLELMEKLK